MESVPGKQSMFEQEALVHSNVLYRFGLQLTGNAQDADDLVQETYLKAYRFWDQYTEGTNIRAWLFRILKNSFLNEYRRKARKPEMVEYTETTLGISEPEEAISADIPHDQLHTHILDDDISSAVSGLDERFRVVLVLCDLQGLRYEEIAQVIGCPVGTVRSRLHRARRLLRLKLYEYAMARGYVRSAIKSPRPVTLMAGAAV